MAMEDPHLEPDVHSSKPGRASWPWVVLGAVIVIAGIYLVTRVIAGTTGDGGAVARQQATETPTHSLVFATVALTPTATPTLQSTGTPTSTSTPTRTPTPTPTSTPTSTPTPTPIVVITGLNALGRLETAQYAMQTIVDLQHQPEGFLGQLAGTDQLLLVAEGEVVAGFDLEKVKPSDIIVHGTAVTITLPPPEILYSRVDNEKTYVFERRTGLLRRPDPNLETQARRLAERRLLDWALERGILAQANKFGRIYLEGFLHSLGLTEINMRVGNGE
jgi:hypothetical protein